MRHFTNVFQLQSTRIAGFILLGLLTAWFCWSECEPISRNESHSYRLWLAGIAAALSLARFHRRPIEQKAGRFARQAAFDVYTGILIIGFVFGIFNYYQFDRKVVTGLDDYTDIAYYYVNTKFLNELGYTSFYAAVLYADLTYKNRHATKIPKYRDLRDYREKDVAVAFQHGKEIKEQSFTRKRWKEFSRDIDWFLQRKTTSNLKDNFFVDHGYNPPPTWAVLGGVLANKTPVNSVKYIALVDVLFIVAMLAAIVWAFGFESMLYVGIFFLCSFSGRWPVLTHSLLRFDWSATLVIAFCAFKKERWILAGALLSYAALTRVFPAVFFFAWAVVALRDIWRSRALPVQHIKVAAGAVAVAIVLIVGALIMYGPVTFEQSAENLVMHNESFSSHRVGLGGLLVYHGETTREEINRYGGIAIKEQQIHKLQPELRLIGVLTVLLLGVYIWRMNKTVTDVFHLALIPFYCVTNAQINYWYVRLPLVLWHASKANEPVHKIGLFAIFTVEVVTHYALLQGVPRYTVTSACSIAMAAYFSVLLLAMSAEVYSAALPKNKQTRMHQKVESPAKKMKLPYRRFS